MTLAAALTKVRYLLDEPTAKMWSDVEINAWLNDGQRSMCIRRGIEEIWWDTFVPGSLSGCSTPASVALAATSMTVTDTDATAGHLPMWYEFTIAGDTQTYALTAEAIQTATGVAISFTPGLKVAITSAQLISGDAVTLRDVPLPTGFLSLYKVTVDDEAVTAYTIYHNTLIFDEDQEETVKVYGTRAPDTATADVDFELPDAFVEGCIDYACWAANQKDEHYDEGGFYWNLFLAKRQEWELSRKYASTSMTNEWM